jgi:hypothetical protein
MSLNIFYEDGRGNIIDEHGNDPMDMEEVVVTDPFALETLANLQIYKEKMPPPRISTTQSTVTGEEAALKKKEEIIKKVYRLYNDDQRRSFIILKIEKLISSRAAAL